MLFREALNIIRNNLLVEDKYVAKSTLDSFTKHIMEHYNFELSKKIDKTDKTSIDDISGMMERIRNKEVDNGNR